MDHPRGADGARVMTAVPAWSEYLRAFHGARSGITEDVLARATADGVNPYRWLAEPLEGVHSTVVDLACGSGPLHRELPQVRWVGVDLSTAELARAAVAGAGPLVRADVTYSPLRSDAAAAVVCSMALMIVEPLDAVLSEVARVLVPGGLFAALIPAEGPLSGSDRLRYLRLLAALRLPRLDYPNRTELERPAARLAAHGLQLITDDRCRFRYPLSDDGAASTLVRSLYLPGVPVERIATAERIACRWRGGELGIPLRRLVCRLDPPTTS